MAIAVETGGETADDAREGDRDGAERSEGVMPPEPLLARFESREQLSAEAKARRSVEAEEDRGYVARAQQGDHAAFRKLVERHQRRGYLLAFQLVRDENDAREIVQDAFIRVHKGLPTFQGDSSFYTWLYRIIKNLAIDLLRKPGRREAELDLRTAKADDEEHEEYPLLGRIDGADPIDVIRRKELQVRITAALDALPEYHRGVILLREVDGLSYEEMAVVMGVSKGTIMSRLFHARQKLQKALADCYEERGGPSKAERRSHDADGEEPGDAQDQHDATDGGDSNGEEEGS